ncbi:hypothetical protein Tco_0851215 [Tanacetum coccineum]
MGLSCAEVIGYLGRGRLYSDLSLTLCTRCRGLRLDKQDSHNDRRSIFDQPVNEERSHDLSLEMLCDNEEVLGHKWLDRDSQDIIGQDSGTRYFMYRYDYLRGDYAGYECLDIIVVVCGGQRSLRRDSAVTHESGRRHGSDIGGVRESSSLTYDGGIDDPPCTLEALDNVRIHYASGCNVPSIGAMTGVYVLPFGGVSASEEMLNLLGVPSANCPTDNT